MIYIATKTLAAIEAAFQKDQGAAYRGFLKKLMPTAADAYDTDQTPFRKHLGASIIGRKCTREIWYNFHWASRIFHNSKTLRLFNRGHLEEPRMVALLRTIGCEVWQYDQNGKQFRIDDDSGHFGGSLDAVVRKVPDWPEVAMLGEFKTHGEKSFNELEAKGVCVAKWEHVVQQNLYMGEKNLPASLYLATNKNTDHIYAELVPFEKEVFERYKARAQHIITIEKAPERISNNPSWFECKFCDYRPICHGKDAPTRNCRTCVHSHPVTKYREGEENLRGMWWCDKHACAIAFEIQLTGCPQYEVNPEIKPPL